MATQRDARTKEQVGIIMKKPKHTKREKLLSQKEIDKQEKIKKFGKEHLINQNRIAHHIQKTRTLHEQNKIKKSAIHSAINYKTINLESSHSIKGILAEYEKILGTNLRENDKKKITKKYNVAKKESLKTKLFQTLGSKLCSICSSKEESKLGFSHVSDNSFMIIPQLTWDKYIDEPELSIKNLQVVCSDCNSIRQSKLKIKKTKSLKKKSNIRTAHTWAQG